MQTFVVIGLGQFGRHVAITLTQLGHEVVAVDADMAKVEEIKDLVGRAVRADASEERTLRAMGASEVDVGIVALGEDDFEAAVLAVAALQKLGVKRILARSSNAQRGQILSLVGAHQVVYPEIEMGERVARTLAAPGVLDQRSLPSGQTLAEIKVPASLAGLSVSEAGLRAKYGLNVLAIQRDVVSADGKAQRVSIDVQANERLAPGDVLLMVGERERIESFSRLK